jgi:hypothetical protein
MKRLLLLFWVFGAALYAMNTSSLFPSESPGSIQTASVTVPASSMPSGVSLPAPVAPSASGVVPSDDLAGATKSEIATPESPKAAARRSGKAYYEWSHLSRGAFVHKGPSVSSPLVGYYPAGTDLQLLRREGGWVNIIESASLNEGWIYEINVTPRQPNESDEPNLQASPKLLEETALEVPNETDVIPKRPRPNLKFKKGGKHYGTTHRPRRAFRFAFRFRGFLR